ncbi:MAG: exodeoxyribonuclease VII small subunit [Pirellulaceae bacterium]
MAKKKTNESTEATAKGSAAENSATMMPSFEASIEELELIVRRLELGGGALDEALSDYSKAIGLLKTCHARLEQAERKIEILSGVDAQGNPVTQPLDDNEASLEEKRGTRSDRRSAGNHPTSIEPSSLF